MSEFKGTKGKWSIGDPTVSFPICETIISTIKSDYDSERVILTIAHVMPKASGAKKYNALLISKAPEMLEILKDIVIQGDEMFSHGEPSETYYQLLNRAEFLIKKATEL